MKKAIILATFLIAVMNIQPAYAVEYTLDADHTTVSFKIRHLLTQVRGQFRTFEGDFNFEPGKPETWWVNAKIDAASIDTNVKDRDNHLRSPDFFNVAKYPDITFKSEKVTDADEESAKIQGTLTMHGISKPVVLDLEIHGVAEDPWGNVRSGFTATTKVNRKDFGLGWNEVLESGQVLVGEKVKITIEVEGSLKK